MNLFLDDGIWLGSEASLLSLLDRMDESRSMDLSQLHGWDDEDEHDEDGHPLLNVHGNVGVVDIQGSLTNRESPWNRFFGITAYGDIRNALATAVNNYEVETILLNIDSPGGAAVGISEIGALIRDVDRKVKPVHAYTGGTMDSAAYWLGSQARKIYAADMAELGSIGVIMVHKEFTEAFKQQGIKVNVIRTGKFKALINPYEKLTDTARAQIEERQNTFYTMFVNAVATGRKKSPTEVRTKMAEGRTFLGQEAVDVGLADSVGFFDQIVARLQSTGKPGNSRYTGQPGTNASSELAEGETMPKQVALSTQARAALAAGASADVLAEQGVINSELSAEEQAAAAAQLEADQQAAAAAEAATGEGEGGEGEDTAGAEANTEANAGEGEGEGGETAADAGEGEGEDTAEADAAAAAAAEAAAKPGADNSLLDLMRQLTKAESRAETAEEKLANITELNTALTKIARVAIQRMQVGLGGSTGGVDALEGTALLSAYTETEKTFCNKFQVAGVSVITDEAFDKMKKKADNQAASGVHTASVRATRLGGGSQKRK